MHYTVREISGLIQGHLTGLGDSLITDLLIDSRKVISPEYSLFFALTSNRNDGHNYIPELLKKGVRNFVVSRLPEETEKLPGTNFIKVENTLDALQLLARKHRKEFNIPVIAITGSNGKTIIKEWLFQLLSRDYNTLRSPKSYNSQIGVPLSVWQLHPDHHLAVFEAGISETGEMESLKKIIEPTIGIFANIGSAHDENFSGREQKINEKLKLFSDVNTLIYCKDHKEIHNVITSQQLHKNTHCLTWGKDASSDIQVKSITKENGNSKITIQYQSENLTFSIPFIDKASVENSLHCVALLLLMEMPADGIIRQMESLTPIAMRLEMKEGINNCYVINDSYNSDINSLAIALDFMGQQKQSTKRTIILSDILQSGKKDDILYKEVAGLLKKKGIERLIGIGKGISSQAGSFSGFTADFFTTTEEFLEEYPLSSFQNEIILLKGARVFTFEKISQVLQQKAHETVMEIDMDALVHNLNYFRSRIHPDTKVMVMVKASSYGSGSFEIANALQYHHADYLAVAYADEGIELRKAGITLPIMVMNPDNDSFDPMLRFNLEPEIYSFRTLQMLTAAMKNFNGKADTEVFVHLKLDTGMRRLGFEEEEIEKLIKEIKKHNQIRIRSVFSHLAASDDPLHDDFTRTQIDRFASMANKIDASLNYKVLRHIVNSAGINRFPDAHFDMVRLGISLYGITSNPFEIQHLKNVSTLKSTISQVKRVLPGESIGYNRAWVSEDEMTIGIVAIGYADGLSRKLSNGRGRLWVNGHLVPIIGNVCMDMCMIDITHIPAKEGDMVIIFGEEKPINDLADELGTIPYEILTGISRRVKRVYFQE